MIIELGIYWGSWIIGVYWDPEERELIINPLPTISIYVKFDR